MTSSPASTAVQLDRPVPRRRGALRFALHYVEMVVSMVAGMYALGALWNLVWPGLAGARTDLQVLVMATDMALGMGAWMRLRGHSWRGIAEMSAAMYLPFAVLALPYWAGAIGGGALMTGGHALMLPAMFGAMWWRREDYLHGHRQAAVPDAAPDSSA